MAERDDWRAHRGKSGAWVLDVDDPALFEAACKELDLQLPQTQRSETGKGYHLWWKWQPAHPVRNAQKSVKGWPFERLPGAEVRGEGGYVIVPPSQHPDGKLYRWSDEREPVQAPDELMAIVRKTSAPIPTADASKLPLPSAETDTDYGVAALEIECALINAAEDGEQECTLNNASLRIGGLVATDELSFRTASTRLIEAGLSMVSYRPEDPWDKKAVSAKVMRSLRDGIESPRVISSAVLGSLEVSEDAIALAFTRRYEDHLRYDVHAGRWFEWDGSRWVRDDKRRAFHYARELIRQLGHSKRSLCKASVAGAVEKFAQCDPALAITADEWDTDPMLLGTPKGTVDLRTGEMHEPNPSNLITKQTAVAPEAGEPVIWLKFLSEALQNDVEMIRFVQQWCGYCLTGDIREQTLVNIYGDGGNGKGVYLNTILYIMGDYAKTAAMETFTKSKHEGHSTDLAMLAGARLVSATETEAGAAWAEAKIKAMTGGDPISARFMRRDFFTYTPQFKLTIVGNYALSLTNVDEAMRRRLLILPFTNKPRNVDELLQLKLRAEAGRILSWAIEGCIDWLNNGFIRPQTVLAATSEYFTNQDTMGQWLEDCCIREPDQRETPTTLFESWRNYALEARVRSGTAKDFAEQMKKRGFEPSKSGSSRFYRGIGLHHQFGDLLSEAERLLS